MSDQSQVALSDPRPDEPENFEQQTEEILFKIRMSDRTVKEFIVATIPDGI